MLKILYAANNYNSSYYTLKRFVETYSKYYSIKTSAYSKSIQDLNVNWTLDALLDFRGKSTGISFKNSNFALYVREISRFAPNLIISDVEPYTSYAALELGIPVWQVSPLLLYYGVKHKTNLYKYYSGTFAKDGNKNQYINYIINNSDKKLILSHLGDLSNSPQLKDKYEWVRPNYEISNIINIDNSIGMADAYFANLQLDLKTNYNEPESIITSYYNKRYGLSGPNRPIFETSINTKVKFLSQYLKDMDI
jgi:hypothetical protein